MIEILQYKDNEWFVGESSYDWYVKNLHVSCSYAGAIFADACLKGLNGVPDVVECSYVQSNIISELPFFASKVI